MKFNAHLDTMFAGQTPEQKIKQFAELGFEGYELWCHWDYNLDELAALNRRYHIKTIAVATEFIPLTDKNRHDDYLAGLDRAIAACQKLNCPIIISQVGNLLPAPSPEYQQQYIINGLRRAAPKLVKTDIVLAVEPLNTLVDHAGYFLTLSVVAASLIKTVNAKEVKMLFDIYHQQISEGNLINNIIKYLPVIAHFHVADHPGRHQPGTGEINYHNVFAAIDQTGYTEYAGLEFFPQGNTLAVLKQFNLDYQS